MKKITQAAKDKGEMLMRGLSDKAQNVYNTTDPLTVAQFDDNSISVRGCLGDYDDMTEKELEAMLEDLDCEE